MGHRNMLLTQDERHPYFLIFILKKIVNKDDLESDNRST